MARSRLAHLVRVSLPLLPLLRLTLYLSMILFLRTSKHHVSTRSYVDFERSKHSHCRCVDWAPAYGHYIATGSSDRTARLYACDHAPQPLRIFIGHKADVTTVAFHPNINYLATGSADRAVRLFDIRSGKGVRLYTGHKVRLFTLFTINAANFATS